MAELRIRPFAAGDRQWALHLVCERWGSETVVTRGAVHRPAELPGFVAVRRGERIGLVTYNVDQDGCQIVSLDSVEQGQGCGTALLEAHHERQRGSVALLPEEGVCPGGVAS